MSAVLSTAKIGTPADPVPQREPARDIGQDFAQARSRYADAQGALQSARAALKRAEADVDHSYAGRVAALYAKPGANVADEVQAIRDRGTAARAAIPLLQDKVKEAEQALQDARAGLRHVIQRAAMQRREASLQRYALAAVELRNAYHDLLGVERACISLAALKAGGFDAISEPIRVAVPSEGKRAAAYEVFGLWCYATSTPDDREVSRIMLALVDELKARAGDWVF